jgi:CHAT domain-containing protein/Tfp pilus assembly protein PilF
VRQQSISTFLSNGERNALATTTPRRARLDINHDSGASPTCGASARWLLLLLAVASQSVLGATRTPPSGLVAGAAIPVSHVAYGKGQGTKADSAQGNAALLNSGEVVGREIAGNDKHLFRLPLKQGQYARVMVEQRGVDLVVKLNGPDGRKLVEMDSPNSRWGPEVVSLVAKTDGEYQVELRPNDSWAPAGSYELRLDGPREPSPADLERVAAESAFLEGQSLRAQGTAESRPAAIERYEKARELWKALGDGHGETYALHNTGKVFAAMGDLPQARRHFEEALSIRREAGDLLGQAMVLNDWGAAQRDVASPSTALEFYNESLKLRRVAGDPWGQAQSLNNIGIVYARTGDMAESLKYYEQALPLWLAAGDLNQEANTLNNIAGAVDEMGNPQQAIEKYERALKFWQEVKNLRQVAIAQNNIAKIYDGWGETQKALELYKQALSLQREVKNRAGEAQVLDNLGMLYVGLGDAPGAMESFDKALRILEEDKDSRKLAVTLHNMGAARALQGEFQEALKLYERAREYRLQAQDRPGMAATLAGIGSVYASMGEPQKALEYYRQSLEAYEKVESRWGQALVLDRLGYLDTQMGDLAGASAHFDRALERWKAVGDKQGQALSLHGRAQVERARNNLEAARDNVEEAVGIVESLRTKVNSRQLRTTYLAAKLNYYELAIEVRMQLYERSSSAEDLEAAFNLSERSRARSLLELLAVMGSEIRGGDADPELPERMSELERHLNAVSEKLVNLRSANSQPEKNPALVKKIAGLTAEYARLLNEQDEMRAGIGARSPRYARLMQSQPLQLSSVQQLLDDDVVLLEYSFGDRSSYVWAVTRTSITGRSIAGRAAIEQVAGVVKKLLSSPPRMKATELPAQFEARVSDADREYKRNAAQLSRLVLDPVAARLDKRWILIVADGQLRFIPFGALPEPRAPEQRAGRTGSVAAVASPAPLSEPPLLVDNHIIAYQPSASVMAMLKAYRRRPPDKLLAVFADPVFNGKDERVRPSAGEKHPGPKEQAGRPPLDYSSRNLSDGAPALERLTSSLREADEIMRLVPRGAGMKAIGFNASRAAAMRPDLGRYKIVHFATHGLLDDEHPELSSLVLSLVNEQGQPQDGYLLLHDVYNLSLPVELVVLSACRTGVGKEVKGEGLIGLTRGFMHAGAARVVSTLWQVDTDDTADLMRIFYRHMLKDNLPPAMALQAAQVEMRKSHSAPYRWAGFILQGEWR